MAISALLRNIDIALAKFAFDCFGALEAVDSSEVALLIGVDEFVQLAVQESELLLQELKVSDLDE